MLFTQWHSMTRLHEGTDPSTFNAASRVDAIALFCSAMDALERRRAAGTLMQGKCTAEEAEAWWQAEELKPCANVLTAAGTASLATLAGYLTFLSWTLLRLQPKCLKSQKAMQPRVLVSCFSHLLSMPCTPQS